MIGLRPDISFAVVKLAQQIANPSNFIIKLGYTSVNTCLLLADISLFIMD